MRIPSRPRTAGRSDRSARSAMARVTFELTCEIEDEHGVWRRSMSYFMAAPDQSEAAEAMERRRIRETSAHRQDPRHVVVRRVGAHPVARFSTTGGN